jgi:hypothetical protein
VSPDDRLIFDRVSAQQELLMLVEGLSEDAWASAWQRGIEYDLWAFAEGRRSGDYGRITIGGGTATRLRELATEAGGWWAWSGEFDGAVFVPLDAWQKAATRNASDE